MKREKEKQKKKNRKKEMLLYFRLCFQLLERLKYDVKLFEGSFVEYGGSWNNLSVHFFFFLRIYFLGLLRLKFTKF